jgi:hypothetical protein
MEGRYSWYMFCWDSSDQLMTKIVLSGSGKKKKRKPSDLSSKISHEMCKSSQFLIGEYQ